MRPIFSVIIDNFNYGNYIEEAINSVLTQTFPQKDIEIIVVDDGSTDDSLERVKKYKDRVKCISKINGGQASAFNLGIKHAEGEIIAFLDSDDYWHPMKLQYVFEEFQKSKLMDFVFHFMNVIDNNHKIIDRYIFPAPLLEKKSGQKECYFERYLKGMLPWFSPASGMIARAECLQKAVPIPEDFRIGADLYLHYILPLYLRELCLVKKPLGYYRIHGNNLSGGNLLTIEKIRREMKIMSLIKEHLEKHSQKLEYDICFIKKRLESMVTVYNILLCNLEGREIEAFKMAMSFNDFLPEDTFFYKLSRKITLLISVILPSSLYLWLQRKYRNILYLLQHDS